MSFGYNVLGFGSHPSRGGPLALDYLVIAGGAGAARSFGGGSGAGGYLEAVTTDSFFSGVGYTVTIGGGGANGGVSYQGGNGNNSSIAGTGLTTITATGGGAGAKGPNDAARTGGGSGGGGQEHGRSDGIAGQGNRGGSGRYRSGYGSYHGGGGGGADQVGYRVVLEVGAKLGTAFKEGAAVAVVPTMEMVEPPAPEEVVVEVVDTLCVAPRE
jgi:hypothetical protein